MKTTITMCLLFATISLAMAAPLFAADDAPIDMEKARGLYQREQKGEKLSAEEQAYLDRAKAERAKRNQQGGQQGQRAGGNAPAPRESTGMIPLTDLTDKYKGVNGGLYGDGKNEPPAEHAKRGASASAAIQPLDSAGKPAADGKIVLMSIGMSNTTMEFARFKAVADKDAAKNPRVVIVDAAQGGMDAPAWVEGTGADAVWQVADKRLKNEGVDPQQVQAVWIKQALKGEGSFGEFPKHSDVLRDDLVKILNRAQEHFPNLKIAYLSSRIYAGLASSNLNPEPYAYETAFSVRGVIEQQIKGDPALNSDPTKGPVKAPVVLWGPYLWADGTKGRKIDKLVWTREDFGGDGTHPSNTAREKIAEMLLTFFKTDATAKAWFVAPQK
jgi:hypothetical protein